MLLSEMFGVKRDANFMVEGLRSVYKIGADEQGIERIERVDEGARKSEVVYGPSAWRVIAAAPVGIIRLPPPLTDEQRDQLKAIWTLGGRWLAKDASGIVFCYQARPEKEDIEWTVRDTNDKFMEITYFVPAVVCLVSWSDTEPYDIAKALGVEG